MSEHHHHQYTTQLTKINRAFVVGIVLNLSYVVLQVFIGLRIHSLSLLSDAGHNFLDVAGLVLAMIAFKLSHSKSTEKYTYGYKKASILISLFNAVVLLISIGAIGYESVIRFNHPEPLPGKVIAFVALVGIIINGVSAFLFYSDKGKDINIQSAFLHLASDALVSFGLVFGGIIICFTNFFWIDSVLSIIICLLIIVSTWKLLKESLRLSLDGVPDSINAEMVQQAISKINGIKEVHHIHIWAISTTENALTAHFVFFDTLTKQQIMDIKLLIKKELQYMRIQHVTIEIEFETEECEFSKC